jgi:hypothetical protein
VLGVVGDERRDDDDGHRHRRDLSESVEEAARAPGRHRQAYQAGQAQHDDEPRRFGPGEEEPWSREDHHHQIEQPQPGAPVVMEVVGVHHVVQQEHQPGDDARPRCQPSRRSRER